MARNIVWISPSLGYCVDVNEAYEHIEAFQEFSQTNFVCTAIDKNFGGISKFPSFLSFMFYDYILPYVL